MTIFVLTKKDTFLADDQPTLTQRL